MIRDVSTNRGERVAQLRGEIERLRATAAALRDLADVIDAESAPRASHVPLWRAIASRLRDDATAALRDAQRATQRLHDIRDAEDAAARWIPTRGA